VKRREFIAGLGSAAAWPLSVGAQQPATPVIGYLSAGSPDVFAERLRAFRQSLQEAGFVEGAMCRSIIVGLVTTSNGCPLWRPTSHSAR
jgi:hypothetical protein